MGASVIDACILGNLMQVILNFKGTGHDGRMDGSLVALIFGVDNWFVGCGCAISVIAIVIVVQG